MPAGVPDESLAAGRRMNRGARGQCTATARLHSGAQIPPERLLRIGMGALSFAETDSG